MYVCTYNPHNPTITVAPCNDRTNGAINIDPAKITCEHVHAVSKLGLYFSNSKTSGAMLAGGRGVNSAVSAAGFLTNHGSMTDITKVMTEKPMKARLPVRPTSPVRSPDCFTERGAS